MAKLKLSNWSKPSEKKLKMIADAALYSLPLLNVGIMSLPISLDIKAWLTFGLTCLTVVFKFISKLTSQEDNETTEEVPV